MTTIRYLRKLPQRTGLTGMATRTPIEQSISSRVPLVPRPSETPSTGLNKIIEDRKQVKISPTLNNFSELGGSGMNPGETAEGADPNSLGTAIGNDIAASMANSAVSGAVPTGIAAFMLDAPLSIAVPALAQSSARSSW